MNVETLKETIARYAAKGKIIDPELTTVMFDAKDRWSYTTHDQKEYVCVRCAALPGEDCTDENENNLTGLANRVHNLRGWREIQQAHESRKGTSSDVLN